MTRERRAQAAESAFPDGRWMRYRPPHGWQPRVRRTPRMSRLSCHRHDVASPGSAPFPDLPTHRHVAPNPSHPGRGEVHDDADDNGTPRYRHPGPLRGSSELPTSRRQLSRADHARREPELPRQAANGSAQYGHCGSAERRPRPPSQRQLRPAPDGAGRALAGISVCRSGVGADRRGMARWSASAAG